MKNKVTCFISITMCCSDLASLLIASNIVSTDGNGPSFLTGCKTVTTHC